MRTQLTALLVLAAACTQAGNANLLDPVPVRPARENLLAAGEKLGGRTLTTRTDGGWVLRGTAQARAVPGAAAKSRAPRGAGAPARGLRSVAAPGAEARDEARLPPGPPAKVGESREYVAEADAGEPATVPTSALAAAHPVGPGSAGPAAGAPPALRAGATDDNLAFDDFLAFLAEARGDAGLQQRFVDLDVDGRTALQVLDADGAIVPGIQVTIVDEAADRVAWRGTTYGDGRVPFYPRVARDGATPPADYLVEVACADGVVRRRWDGHSAATVQLPVRAADQPLRLDVAFVLDTTGSMGDEIAAIKATLLEVTRRLRALGREFDLRYGAVLYRDVGDEYVTAQHDFTADIEAFDELLRSVQASGGGDGPESLNQGLAVAIDGLSWGAGAAHVAFLIADAPPHLDYDNDVPYDRSLVAAVARGIRVHTVAASGLDRVGSVVFRQIAQFTRGEFVFIEYGGDLGASASKHGVRQATGNNLDEILYTRIRDEIARWGREADAIAEAAAEER